MSASENCTCRLACCECPKSGRWHSHREPCPQHAGEPVGVPYDDVTHVTQDSTIDTQRDAVESAHRRDTYPARGTEAP